MTWSRTTLCKRDWQDFLPHSDDVCIPARNVGLQERHGSRDLNACTSQLVLNLEGDAPLDGERVVFLVNTENPCSTLPDADQSNAAGVTVAVRQRPPCRGDETEPARARRRESSRCAWMAAQASPSRCCCLRRRRVTNAVTTVPAALAPQLSSAHALCFRITQRRLKPLWVIDWAQLSS